MLKYAHRLLYNTILRQREEEEEEEKKEGMSDNLVVKKEEELFSSTFLFFIITRSYHQGLQHFYILLIQYTWCIFLSFGESPWPSSINLSTIKEPPDL